MPVVDELAGHAVHATLPAVVLYVPAAQAVQVPPDVPASPLYPALHVHADCAVDPVPVVDELVGHAVHEMLVLPDALYFPKGQAVHPLPLSKNW